MSQGISDVLVAIQNVLVVHFMFWFHTVFHKNIHFNEHSICDGLVRYLIFVYSCWISTLKSMSPSPVRRVFTGYVNYDGSDGHSTPRLQRHLFTLSSQLSVDGNNAMLARSPRTVTDRLQHILNAAACIVSGTQKFDRDLTHLLHSELHWLDIPERIQHKLGVTVHRCLQGKALQYLIECCTPMSEVASRQWLRSASRHQLVPLYRCSKFGHWAFSVAGPMVWNSLPDHLRDPTLSFDCFKSRLKTHLFSLY